MNSLACLIIRNRIMELPEYAEAKELVIGAAFLECRGKTVAEMRELGGFTNVLLRYLDGLAHNPNEMWAKFRVDHGSKMWPRTVVDTLREDMGTLRLELQRRCAVFARDQVSVAHERRQS